MVGTQVARGEARLNIRVASEPSMQEFMLIIFMEFGECSRTSCSTRLSWMSETIQRERIEESRHMKEWREGLQAKAKLRT